MDLSVGTPCDPPPAAVVEALGTSGTERGYPASIGSAALRGAAADWMRRRFGVSLDPAQVAACVGTKEFVATAAWFLRLRTPGRDTVLAPALAYPTYAMGARLAGCRVVEVPGRRRRRHSTCRPSRTRTPRRALCLWVNSPVQPDRRALTDLGAAAAWGRARAVPVLSDECYAEFTWDGAAHEHRAVRRPTGVLAVHSLSKRSNLAGVRVGFYAGDAASGRVPRRGPQARRAHGAGTGPGGRRRGLRRRRPRRRASASATAAASAVWPRSCGARGSRPNCRRAASTCGCRCRRGPRHLGQYGGPARGLGAHRSAGRGGRDAREPGRVLRRRRRPGSCGSPRSNPTTGSSWRRTRLASSDHPHLGASSARRGAGGPGDNGAGPVTSGDGRPAVPDRRAVVPGRASSSPADTDALDVVTQAIDLLDRGEARVAEVDGPTGEVVVHSWLKTAILLLFRLRAMETAELGPFEYHDKLPLKTGYEPAGVRVVPGASARWGSFLDRGVILMPSYVNIGARVGADTMVDTWATVGSCAQIGARVHLSGGVGIGGVLEPPNAAPVMVGRRRHHREPVHGDPGRPGG